VRPHPCRHRDLYDLRGHGATWAAAEKLYTSWKPQGFGAPDVPGNSTQAYYPGGAYVDVT